MWGSLRTGGIVWAQVGQSEDKWDSLGQVGQSEDRWDSLGTCGAV